MVSYPPCIGVPVVRTDGRAYGHVITKFSRMGRLPHFLNYGAPSTRARFARAWSSATNAEFVRDKLHVTSDRFTLHGFPRGAGISLALAGVSLHEIMDHVGRKNSRTALHYILS